MKSPDAYILHCSVSASVRQSLQFKFEDYKLPDDVIDTLKQADSISIRPNLSRELKSALDEMRLLQRYLYDRCTIHQGDVHFLHPDFFDEALERIEEIRSKAVECNARVSAAWADELQKWTATVDNFFSSLITDPSQLRLVREAYLSLFPTREEYTNPIHVHVVGPYPASLEVVDQPMSMEEKLANTAAINTAEVLAAAREGARDKSYGKIAELIDDLDTRPANKVGDRVLSDNPKKRGSWQIIHTDIKLAAAHNPALKDISKFIGDLIKCGEQMRDLPKGAQRVAAWQKYTEVREDIRQCSKELLSQAESNDGFNNLQASLSLSKQYEHLLDDIQNCDSEDVLEVLRDKVYAESEVFRRRAKSLEQKLHLASEKIQARATLAESAVELEQTTVESEQDCDF